MSIGQTISLTSFGTPYTEDFNTLATTGTLNTLLITGWTLNESGGGTRDNELYGADNGGSNTGDTYSYGPSANTDRALGGLQSGTLIPVIGVAYTNNTGGEIQSITITYTGEQWRLGFAGRTDRMDFQYSLDAVSLTTGTWIDYDLLDFTAPVTTGTPGALDGNLAQNRTVISATITGLSIPDGGTFWFRWNDLNATNADDGLAIDEYSLTVCCPPLDVQLLNFDVERDGSYSRLAWSTSMEVNNDYFEVQRANNNGLFKSIGIVDGTGNSAFLKSYQFIDKDPVKGSNYYRLKQVDNDGDFDYSPVRQLLFNERNFTVSITPNPATELITIRMQGEPTYSDLMLIDGTGRCVWSEKMKSNNSTTDVQVNELSVGTYMLIIKSGSDIFIERIVISK